MSRVTTRLIFQSLWMATMEPEIRVLAKGTTVFRRSKIWRRGRRKFNRREAAILRGLQAERKA